MNRTIEGTLELPAGVLVSNALLGTTWDVRIAGIEGQLTFPQRQDPEKRALATDLTVPRAANPKVMSSESPSAWGQVVRLNVDPKEGDSFVTHVHLSFDVPASPVPWRELAKDYGNRIHAATPGFLRSLFSWLQAMSQQDLDLAEPKRYAGSNSNPDLVGIDEQGQPFDARTPIGWGITPSHPVSASMWEVALQNASADIDIPLARQLLNGARSALARANYRRAVIDASTAAEISTVTALEARVGSKNEAMVVAELLRGASGLGRKLDLCKRLGVRMPASVQEKLVKIRNLADHAGLTPPRNDAEEAVRCAEEVLDLHVPLPGWP